MLDDEILDAAKHEREFIRPLRMGGPLDLIARVKRLYLKEYLEGEELLWGREHSDKVAQEACERIEKLLKVPSKPARTKSVQEAKIKRRPRRTS
jgi:hypothetical protein